MSAHTPTPWKIIPLHESENGNHNFIEIGVEDFNGRVLAGVDNNDDEDKANAAYIVKAVNCHEELLGQLKYWEPFIKGLAGDVLDDRGCCEDDHTEAQRRLDSLQQAISKAEGRIES